MNIEQKTAQLLSRHKTISVTRLVLEAACSGMKEYLNLTGPDAQLELELKQLYEIHRKLKRMEKE